MVVTVMKAGTPASALKPRPKVNMPIYHKLNSGSGDYGLKASPSDYDVAKQYKTVTGEDYSSESGMSTGQKVD